MRDKKSIVILIDDDKWITDLYGEKLREEDFNIFTANNGKEGVKLINLYKPDLILLDIVMPGGDGFYVLKEIKKKEETKNIPVIVLTNLSNEEDRKNAERLGADYYMVKINYTPDKVAEKIREVLKEKTENL